MDIRRTAILFGFLLVAFHLQAQEPDYKSPFIGYPFTPEIPMTPDFVKVGGFILKVDPTEYGFTASEKNGTLGIFCGKDNDVRVTRISSSDPSLKQEIMKLGAANGWPLRNVTPVSAGKGLRGVMATYGAEPSFLFSGTKAIRWLFVNPRGETICFEADARTAYPDWNYTRFLLNREIFPDSGGKN